jgi:hypothetical protein
MVWAYPPDTGKNPGGVSGKTGAFYAKAVKKRKKRLPIWRFGYKI